MVTLIGHGYVGMAIAQELARQGITFIHGSHDRWYAAGTAIIDAAGVTGVPNVDACEDRKAETILGNVVWPLEVEKWSGGRPVIHIGSGCVYDDYTDGGWTEDDPPNFTGSFYSLTKAVAQEALGPCLSNSYLLRIRMPFGKDEHPKNYLTKIKKYPRLIDVRNSLSCLDDVARVAVWFARNLPTPGIYNVCNPGSVTTREVVDLMGVEKGWFTPEEFRATIKVPRSSCVLNTDKLTALYPMPGVQIALLKCLTREDVVACLT